MPVSFEPVCYNGSISYLTQVNNSELKTAMQKQIWILLVTFYFICASCVKTFEHKLFAERSILFKGSPVRIAVIAAKTFNNRLH